MKRFMQFDLPQILHHQGEQCLSIMKTVLTSQTPWGRDHMYRTAGLDEWVRGRRLQASLSAGDSAAQPLALPVGNPPWTPPAWPTPLLFTLRLLVASLPPTPGLGSTPGCWHLGLHQTLVGTWFPGFIFVIISGTWLWESALWPQAPWSGVR